MNLWAIFGAAGAALLFGVVQWLKLGQARRSGAAEQAGKISAKSAKVDAAVTKAVVDAPTTRDGVVDRLSKGTF